MRTRTLYGLAVGPLTAGTGLTLVGLYPGVDDWRVFGLGLLLVLVSVPPWNAVMLRRVKIVSDDQLSDTFDAGYALCRTHFAQGADGPSGSTGGQPPGFIPPEDPDPTEERHDQ